MRFLLVGPAPWSKSGYGTQLTYLARILRALGHEVAFFAYTGLIGVVGQWEGARVYPRGRMSTLGLELIPPYYRDFGGDCVITVCDGHVLTPIAELIAAAHPGEIPFAHWLPVDCEPLGAPDRELLTMTGSIPIAMSRHGERQLAEAGFRPLYVPHCVDLSVHHPQPPEVRAAARAAIGASDRTFVITMLAENGDTQDRKNFYGQLAAFGRFHSRHPDSLLYAYTVADRHPVALNLDAVAEAEGITNAVVFPPVDEVSAGLTSTETLVRAVHAAADLGTCASKAEGFGLPGLEFQAAGVPVVAGDGSAMTEVCAPGWLVEGDPAWSVRHSARWRIPSVGGIDAAYEDAWRARQDPAEWEATRAAAISHAIHYGLEEVTPVWADVVKGIQDRIG